MFVEFATAAALVYSYNWIKDIPVRKIKRAWNEELENSTIHGIKNIYGQTFIITSIYPRKYGYYCCVKTPKGLSVEGLQNAKRVLEDGLNCVIEIEKQRFTEYVEVKIVKKILEFEYSPVKTENNELFLGYKFDGAHYILDLNRDPHILIAGKTGTGKSFLFASIVTNLIYYHKKDIEIYLLQVMKGEIDIFKNCPSVKFTSDNQDEILVILKKISEIIHKRSKMFAEQGIKNITQWNQHFPEKRLKRIIVGAEEISFFMNHDKEENPCFKHFTDIVKAGRSAGVHFIALTQRTTIANLPSEIKAQMTVITAKQRSEVDSKNAIDITDAVSLEKQEFIASSNDGYIRFKAPSIDEDFVILNKYVPEIKIPTPKLNISPVDEKSTLDDRLVGSISNKLTYEETLKLREHYECYTLVKEQPAQEPVKEEVLEAAATAPEPKRRSRKRSGVISIEEVKK